MKIFLLLVLMAAQGFAAIDKVRTFERHGDRVEVTLWGNSEVLRFDEKDPRVPCIEDAYKSRMRVDLAYDKAGKIQKCRLAGHELPGKRPAR